METYFLVGCLCRVWMSGYCCVLMLRTSFIAMYKILGVLGMAGLKQWPCRAKWPCKAGPAEQSGSAEQLSEPSYSFCLCD